MTRVRVLTFNVWNTQGDTRRIELINRELLRLQPDLVSLQEVVSDIQLAALLDGTGLYGSHQSELLRTTMPHADVYGGTALATRWKHEIVELLDPRTTGAMDVPWCTLAATVPIPDVGQLLFVATTGPWRPDAEFARERLALALTDLDERHRQKIPTIIAGDFNASPDAGSARYLRGLHSISGRSAFFHDAWNVVGKGPGFTWTTDHPPGKAEVERALGIQTHHARIDHILIGARGNHPSVTASVHSAALVFDRQIDGMWLSDHYGVMSDIGFQTSA